MPQPAILVVQGTKKVPVSFSQILFFEVADKICYVYTEKRKHILFGTLQMLEKQLPDEQFIRIHRNYIISVEHIQFIEGNSLAIGNKTLPIAKRKAAELENCFVKAR